MQRMVGKKKKKKSLLDVTSYYTYEAMNSLESEKTYKKKMKRQLFL
jgi:hypothetical protein